MKRLTAQWVRKAEDDIRGARSLEQSKPPLNDLICFHCQQSAEKYLKALLQEWGLVPPRIHDLVKLLNLLLPHDATLRNTWPKARLSQQLRGRLSLSRG